MKFIAMHFGFVREADKEIWLIIIKFKLLSASRKVKENPRRLSLFLWNVGVVYIQVTTSYWTGPLNS